MSEGAIVVCVDSVASLNTSQDWMIALTVRLSRLMGPWHMTFRLFYQALSGQNLVYFCCYNLAS
jgi:hypothetical protein